MRVCRSLLWCAFRCQKFIGDGSSRRAISTTRSCILALRPFVIAVPFGSTIQALLDVGVELIDRIEQARAWEAGKTELCRKISHVFGMIITVLEHPYVAETPDLLEDLHRIVKILQEIDDFVGRKTKSKGCKLLRFIQCSSDYERIVEFGSEFDETIKMLTMKSSIQLRLDMQTLKETVELSAEKMEDTFRSSTSTFQSSAEKLTETVQSSTEKIEKTLGTVRPPLAISRQSADLSQKA
ncbi:hypothetical protein ACEPAI_3618 [Sanghuangporus weigelae]